jgi:hypothetical protein
MQLVAQLIEQGQAQSPGNRGHITSGEDQGVQKALASAIDSIIEKGKMYEVELPEEIELIRDDKGTFSTNGTGKKNGKSSK